MYHPLKLKSCAESRTCITFLVICLGSLALNCLKALRTFNDSFSFTFQAIMVMTSSFWDCGVEGLCTDSTLDQELQPSSVIDLTTVWTSTLSPLEGPRKLDGWRWGDTVLLLEIYFPVCLFLSFFFFPQNCYIIHKSGMFSQNLESPDPLNKQKQSWGLWENK